MPAKARLRFEYSCFEFWICFGFRASDLGFREIRTLQSTRSSNVHKPNRRHFLAATSAAVGVPALVPSSAFGANERLNVGHIGVGGRAGSLLQYDLTLQRTGLTQVVALCDIDTRRLAQATKAVPVRPPISTTAKCSNARTSMR
jgi:hypothetical protein